MARSSGRTAFWLLVAGFALAALFAPDGLTRPMRGAFQFLAAPGEKLGHALTLAATEETDRLKQAGLTPEQAKTLRDRNEALSQNLLAVIAERDRLLSERKRLLRLPEHVRNKAVKIYPASLYARDVAALRDSAILSATANRSVKAGRWVTTLRFGDRGKADGIAKGLPVLAGAELVGVVDEVYFGQCRVRLVSDVESRIHGRIYHRLPDGSFRRGATCLVAGEGGGRMSIPRMVIDEKDPIRLGDVVVTRAGEPMLPPSVPIGRITVCRPRRDNPLLYEIQVSPLANLGAIDRVMIVEMPPPPAGPSRN